MIRCRVLTALLTMALATLAAVPSPCLAGPGADQKRGGPANVEPTAPPHLTYPTAGPPVFSSGLFPCSNCHAGMQPDLRRRKLQNEHVAVTLRHAGGQIWCLDCHHPENRDTLRLATGEPLPFSESYRLCGQCHGEKLRDWQSGIHGKRIGQWNGAKQYLLCTGCHSPHDPAFKPLTPLPPPERPGRNGH